MIGEGVFRALAWFVVIGLWFGLYRATRPEPGRRDWPKPPSIHAIKEGLIAWLILLGALVLVLAAPAMLVWSMIFGDPSHVSSGMMIGFLLLAFVASRCGCSCDQ